MDFVVLGETPDAASFLEYPELPRPAEPRVPACVLGRAGPLRDLLLRCLAGEASENAAARKARRSAASVMLRFFFFFFFFFFRSTLRGVCFYHPLQINVYLEKRLPFTCGEIRHAYHPQTISSTNLFFFLFFFSVPPNLIRWFSPTAAVIRSATFPPLPARFTAEFLSVPVYPPLLHAPVVKPPPGQGGKGRGRGRGRGSRVGKPQVTVGPGYVPPPPHAAAGGVATGPAPAFVNPAARSDPLSTGMWIFIVLLLLFLSRKL
jgi:hypothetical protein